jgi:small subunit ribosomal protein S3
MKVEDLLKKRLREAGYGGFDVEHSPTGTHITIYAMKPGIVIGRGGENLRELKEVIEGEVGWENLEISVAEIEVPELNPYVMATRIASAIERGVHFRRAGFWALNAIMNAGALGAEVTISGKLRTERASYEKYAAGYLLKAGEPRVESLREGVTEVQLRPGIYGVKVRILPPTSRALDRELSEQLK